MAKITPSQAEAIRARGLNPDSLSKTMAQERIDKLFPATETAAPAAPVLARPSVIPVAPVAKPIAPAPAPVLPVAPIKPIAPVVEPVKPAAIPDVTTKVPGYLNLQEMANQLVASRATTPTGGIDVTREQEARNLADRILGQPFTLGGTPSPVTASIAAPVKAEQEGLAGLIAALKPQTIKTPAEAEADLTKERLALMDAANQLDKEYAETIQYAESKGLTDQANAAKQARQKLNEPGDPSLKPDLLQRKNYNVSWMNAKEEAAKKGEAPPEWKPPRYGEAGVGETIAAVGSKASEAAFQIKEPGSKIVESPFAYATRLLSAPVSGMVGAVEAGVTDKTIGQTVPERIRGGAGVMGAGIDIGGAIADSFGYTEEAAAADNQVKGKRSAIIAMAGGLGLATDFMLPVVPGSDIAGAASKAGAEAFQVEKALGGATGGALKAGVKQAAKAAAKETPIVGRFMPFEYGKDAFSQGIAKFATDAKNQQTMSDALKVGDELSKNGKLSKWDNLDFDGKTAALEEAYKKVGGQDFKAFQNESGKIGDIYDKGFYKNIDNMKQQMLRRTVMDTVLSQDSKATLARAGALDSNKLMNDLLEFVQKNGGDTSSLKTVPGLFEKATDIVTRSKTPSTATMIGVLDKDQLAALSKQFLQDHAVRSLTKTAMSGPSKMSLLPNYSRITRTSFLPDSETKKVLNFLENSAIGKTKGAAKSAIEKGSKFIDIKGDILAELNRTLGSVALSGEVGEGSSDAIRNIVNEINGLVIKNKSGAYLVQTSDWNNLVEKVTDAYAQTLPGYKSIFDVDQELKTVKPIRKEGEIPVPTTGEVIVKEQYYSKILTPKEVAGGTMENVLVASASKAIEGSKAASYSELSTEFVDAIGQRFGSIPEDFKMVLRNNRSAGLSPQDAWAKTVVDNYNRHAEGIIDKIIIESGADAAEAIEIKKANIEQMFDDYTAMLYGGYESVIEAINTTGRSQFLDGMLIAPFEMRQLAFVLNQTDFVKNIRQEFIKLAMDGKNGEALVKLRDVHAVLQGRPMKTFIKSKEQLEALHAAAKEADKYGILKKGTGDTFQTDEAFQGKRGIFEMWNYGGETAPMFFVDSHLDLVSAQYMTRRQSAIVSEVYQDWTSIYPELFPSTTTIDKNVERYMGFLKDTPLINKDVYSKILQDLAIDIELSYMKQPEIPVQMAAPKDIPEGLKFVAPAATQKTEAEILAEFEKDKQNVAAFLKSEYYPDFAKRVMDVISQDPSLGREVYVGLVEDSLTRLSASEQISGRYSAAIRTRQAAISNDMLLDIKEGNQKARANIKATIDDYKTQVGDFKKNVDDFRKVKEKELKAELDKVSKEVDPKISELNKKIKAMEAASAKYPKMDMTYVTPKLGEEVPDEIKVLRSNLDKLKQERNILDEKLKAMQEASSKYPEMDTFPIQEGGEIIKVPDEIKALRKEMKTLSAEKETIDKSIKSMERTSAKHPEMDVTYVTPKLGEEVPEEIKALREDIKAFSAERDSLINARKTAEKNLSSTLRMIEEESDATLSELRAGKNLIIEDLQKNIINPKLQKEILGKTINALFFSPEAYNYHRVASGAEDYVKALYPQLRAETTPLFYDTLKTSVRNAATNNLAVLTKGPLEQTQTISLISQDTAAIKGALRRRGGIDEFTKSMEELKIDSNIRKLPPEIEMSKDLKTAIEEGLAITDDLRRIAVKNKGTANRLGSVFTDVFGSKEAFFADGRVSAYAKGGVLGGQFLPNLRYMMANYLTAPAIIYSTIGGKYAGSSLKTMMGFNFETNQTMRALLGMDLSGGSARISAASAVDIRLSGGTPREVIVVTTPSGKVYTNYDIAKLVADGGVSRSEASAELTTKVIEELTSYAAVNQKKLMSSEIKGLNNMSENALKQWIIESYGLPFAKTALTGEVAKEGFPLVSGKRRMNMFSEFANNCDTMYRVTVLQDALKTGMSEQQALQLARESLFDYGNLTDIEKGFFARAFWFWTFRRNSYRAVIKSALTNPSRLKNMALANNFIVEMDRDNNIATADYAATRPFMYLVDDPENKQRFALYGPGIPALSAMSELIDYMTVVPFLLNTDRSVGDKLSTSLRDIPLSYAKNAPPGVQTAIGLAFGIDPRRDAKELGYYLDPKLMWWLQQDSEKWATFQSLINIEVVPPDQEVPGRGSYQGRQWRIRKGDDASLRNWFAIQQLMLFAGVQRNLTDYSVLANLAVGEQTSDTQDIRLGGEAPGAQLRMIMAASGVITPIEAVTIQDRIEFNKRAIGEELKKNTYDTKR